jgi:hypothetical protein
VYFRGRLPSQFGCHGQQPDYPSRHAAVTGYQRQVIFMKLHRTLLAAAFGLLLWAVFPSPASAAATRPASANLLGGTCWPGLSNPTAAGGSIALGASIQCGSSIDFAFINMQLRRIVGGFDNGVPGSGAVCMTTTSWDLGCASSAPCETGYYYGVAEFSVSSTSGYSESETQRTATRLITC